MCWQCPIQTARQCFQGQWLQMFYNSTIFLFKIKLLLTIKNHFNKFKTKRGSSFISFNLSYLHNLYKRDITILYIKAVNLQIMRKPHLLTHMMLILNNLIKLLIPSPVLTVPTLKLNFHSITKETLISHKKSLLKKLIFKTHKIIQLHKSK